MKAASAELKRTFKEEINLDDIEDLHDEMEDIMMDQEEIQEVMGRSFGDVEDVDEDELMEELDGLDDELGLDELENDDVYLPEASNDPISLPSGPTSVPAGGVPAAVSVDD